MSALLQFLARTEVTGAVPYSLIDPIDHYCNGLPITASGSLAAEALSNPVRWHQAIPFSVTDRVCIQGSPATYFDSGAKPMHSTQRVSFADSPPLHYSSGVGYSGSGGETQISFELR